MTTPYDELADYETHRYDCDKLRSTVEDVFPCTCDGRERIARLIEQARMTGAPELTERASSLIRRAAPPSRSIPTDSALTPEPSMTASPRAVLGEPMDELERAAKAVAVARIAYAACNAHTTSDARLAARRSLAEALAAFDDEATPERIAQLVALAKLTEKLTERVALLDRVIGDHHSASIMREEFDVCPVCTAHGGVQFFSDTYALLRAARTPAGPPTEDSR